MRAGVLILMLALTLGVIMWGRSQRSAPSVAPVMLAASAPLAGATKPDFDKEIKPILQTRCLQDRFDLLIEIRLRRAGERRRGRKHHGCDARRATLRTPPHDHSQSQSQHQD